MGPRAGLDGRKISSPPGLDPGPSSPYSVAILTELHTRVARPMSVWYNRLLCVRWLLIMKNRVRYGTMVSWDPQEQGFQCVCLCDL